MKSLEALERKAIKAAGGKNWAEAEKINLFILKLQPKNIAALNRLAWAYAEQGKIKEAKTSYKKVLAIDKYNLIASKNLKRLSGATKEGLVTKTPIKKISSLFLEEAGKTKVVSLVRLAPPKVLATLRCAEPVKLIPKKKSISVRNAHDRYLGIIPDDLSFRLLKFIKRGNKYKAWIKGVEKQNLQIFIREIKRTPKSKNIPSFPSSSGGDYIPYFPPDSVHQEKPEMTPTGEVSTKN